MNLARSHSLWLAILSTASQWQSSESTAQTLCRSAKLAPHQATIWQESFPYDVDNFPVGVCDGKIKIQSDGGMCVSGKVNFAQLQAASGEDRPIYQVTAKEVSFNGHMTTGSGYVWLGPEVFYGYDFITSYIVDGVTYPNDSRINDNLLAASRGTIDGFCLSPAFRQVPRSYTISHTFGLVTKKAFSTSKIDKASYTFISRYFVVYEYHEWTDNSGVWGVGELTFTISNFLTSALLDVAAPDITSETPRPGLFGFIPTNVFAPLARLLVFGTVNTKNFPVPVMAPDDITESIQLDVEYAPFLRAIENGLFSAKSIPLYMYVRFKKVEPYAGSSSTSCFTETSVVLEMTAPQQDGERLDAWVDEVVLPALLAEGATIGMHFGKRIPPNSATLQAALDKYASCGVELNLNPPNCWHPQCKRTLDPNVFTYPPNYYSFDATASSFDVSTSVDDSQ